MTDGDTVTVLHDMKPIKIRLANIDAPERSQAFGMRAKQHLSKLVYWKQVTVDVVTIDRYGRTVAALKVGWKDVSRDMVWFGMAWVYPRYNKDPSLPALQEKAKERKIGLWVDPNSIPPWEFRRKR